MDEKGTEFEKYTDGSRMFQAVEGLTSLKPAGTMVQKENKIINVIKEEAA